MIDYQLNALQGTYQQHFTLAHEESGLISEGEKKKRPTNSDVIAPFIRFGSSKSEG